MEYNRNSEIKRMKELGMTQTQIANKFGITRQRVQQIEYSIGIVRKHERKVYLFVCATCKKDFTSKFDNKKYCSRTCTSEARRKYRTPEEKKAYRDRVLYNNRIRARKYYKEVIKKK